MVSQCFKSNPKFSVKDIFLDNHNWDVYEHQYKDDLRQVEIEEVEKMLSCKKGPPSKHVFGEKIDDWNYLSTSVGTI